MSVLVAKEAPDFTAAAAMPDGTTNDINLSDYSGKYVILFFWPLDFTFVCPTEIIAMDHRQPAFAELGVEVLGVSIDSQFTHHAWRNTSVDKGGIGPVKFPIIADVNHKITQSYGVEHPDANVAMRGTFLIDKNGVVQSQTVNNLPLGRNIDEHLRVVEALKFFEENGEVCPAGWNKGDDSMKPDPTGSQEWFNKQK